MFPVDRVALFCHPADRSACVVTADRYWQISDSDMTDGSQETVLTQVAPLYGRVCICPSSYLIVVCTLVNRRLYVVYT